MSKGRSVAILAMGPSIAAWTEWAKNQGTTRKLADDVWTVNALGDVFRCDAIFHMDDVRVQEIRAAARPDGNIAAMLEWLRTHPGPIYTSRLREGYPGLVEYPVEDVMNDLGIVYFNSTTAYALALAVHRKFSKITLFGFDFTYPNSHHSERGRACVEFIAGIAHARGIQVLAPPGSTLFDATDKTEDKLYGFNGSNVVVKRDPATKKYSLTVTDREQMPTADEVERAYDHSVHPNPNVSR